MKWVSRILHIGLNKAVKNYYEEEMYMIQTNIMFNQELVNVNLIGTDHKLIPSLLHALKTNKITLGSIQKPLVQVDLYSSEAILYSEEGDKYRVPLF